MQSTETSTPGASSERSTRQLGGQGAAAASFPAREGLYRSRLFHSAFSKPRREHAPGRPGLHAASLRNVLSIYKRAGTEVSFRPAPRSSRHPEESLRHRQAVPELCRGQSNPGRGAGGLRDGSWRGGEAREAKGPPDAAAADRRAALRRSELKDARRWRVLRQGGRLPACQSVGSLAAPSTWERSKEGAGLGG